MKRFAGKRALLQALPPDNDLLPVSESSLPRNLPGVHGAFVPMPSGRKAAIAPGERRPDLPSRLS